MSRIVFVVVAFFSVADARVVRRRIVSIVGERGSDVLIGGVAASFESSFGKMNAVYVGSSHVERRSTAVQTPFSTPVYRRSTGVQSLVRAPFRKS